MKKKKISLNNYASAHLRKTSHENASASWQFPLASLPSRSPLYLHLITFAFVNAPRAKRQALMEPDAACPGEDVEERNAIGLKGQTAPKKEMREKREGPKSPPFGRLRARARG